MNEETLIGQWVRRKDDGEPFEVIYLGTRGRNGRRALYGRLQCITTGEEYEVVNNPDLANPQPQEVENDA